MTAPELAVVIPAWDERENLEVLLPALREVLEDLGVTAEIVVADGGSADGTAYVAARRGARVVTQAERGYGGALLTGFAATTAPWIITMDADLSHRPVFVHELWKRRHEADVLIASRYVDGGRADMGPLRRLLSHVLNRAYARVLALPLRDLSSGFRMYRREVVVGLRPAARDFDVLEELLVRAHADGWRVVEVPFHYMARGSGRSHARQRPAEPHEPRGCGSCATPSAPPTTTGAPTTAPSGCSATGSARATGSFAGGWARAPSRSWTSGAARVGSSSACRRRWASTSA